MTWLRSYPTQLVMLTALDQLLRQEQRSPQRHETTNRH